MRPQQQKIVGYAFLFSFLRPSLNFQADFLKTAQGSFMEIWKNATDEGRCIVKYISFVQKRVHWGTLSGGMSLTSNNTIKV